MSWIQNIQKKSQKEKMTIIWTVAGIIFVLLIVVWIISSRFQKTTEADTSLFNKIGEGFHKIKESYKK